MTISKIAEFIVEDHYFLKGRSGFVIGKILSGSFKIGMTIAIDKDLKSLTISGIEFLDNMAGRKFTNALIFNEKPELNDIKGYFQLDLLSERKRVNN